MLGQADGGTVIIRHIEYVEKRVQRMIAKILKAGSYWTPGMNQPRKLNVRFIFTGYRHAANLWDLLSVAQHNVLECKMKNTSTVTIGEMRKAVHDGVTALKGV